MTQPIPAPSKGFILVPDDRMFETNWQAAAAVRPAWDTRTLALALTELAPGDELEVSDSQSFIALSGKTVEFKS